MFHGTYFQLNLSDSIAELVFDSQTDKVNTLSKAAIVELEQITQLISDSDAKALIIRSGKSIFSAGADVTEFRDLFADGAEAVESYLEWVHSVYNGLEDLNIPKVAILNGTAAGGGVELSLLAEYRLGLVDTKVSLPEVKLGIMPGWGGMTRLPRLLGLDTAVQWLTTGKTFRAKQALDAVFLDGVIETKDCDPIAKAKQILAACIGGELDWQSRRKEKQSALTLNMYELGMSTSVAKGMVVQVAGKHYPAPRIMLDVLEKAANETRDKALAIERQGIVRCVDSGVADALVNVFLSDMAVKSKAKQLVGEVEDIADLGVVGAGIMGGGIAYVSAEKSMHVTMKDIAKSGLDLGLGEANKLLAKQVERGRIEPLQMGQVLNRITPTLHDISLENCDLVIEAVVENPKVKALVLPQLERSAPNAIIASNTSSIEISGLAKSLSKPENFCGIHFFNPVHRMPLVEVIRGERTSDETISKVVKYVLQLGKTPIVVNDCAGFFVNRVLTPYFFAFNKLLLDGGQIDVIDRVMTKEFGWPMGPAMLHDVVGMDTAVHVMDVMSKAYKHMPKPQTIVAEAFFEQGMLGQKSGEGFYGYTPDRKGKPTQVSNEKSLSMITSMCGEDQVFDSETILYRSMLPMMFEAIRCLDEGIIATPQEGDLAMIYGLGFPPFHGGLFYHMDQIGLNNLLTIAEQYQDLDAIYQIPEGLVARAKNNQSFYG